MNIYKKSPRFLKSLMITLPYVFMITTEFKFLFFLNRFNCGLSCHSRPAVSKRTQVRNSAAFLHLHNHCTVLRDFALARMQHEEGWSSRVDHKGGVAESHHISLQYLQPAHLPLLPLSLILKNCPLNSTLF
jgi:hypothetical protein